MTWMPSATNEVLQQRAAFLKEIRSFFEKRGVMEVDVPLLYSGVATDPYLEAFAVSCGNEGNVRYLQTSPEYLMKRLLAAGSGPIYYLGKAFRKGEIGAKHNPEFTILEWYRPEWNHIQLINEVERLLFELLGSEVAEQYTYKGLFEARFKIDPHIVATNELKDIALLHGWANRDPAPNLDRNSWLDLLFTHGIEPQLGYTCPVIITDFPATQASLAKTRIVTGNPNYAIAERFEFYYRGLEIANGYHELTCPNEQRRRFEENLEDRKKLGYAPLPLDHALLSALSNGFPPCAGVAVGVDRLFMLKLQECNIAKVLSFAWEQA
jgi:elongation factor P--(R)-beta-lysine ligase